MLKEQGNSITEEWKLYMYLLRCAIRGNEPDESVVKGFSGISSQMLWDMARNNNQVMLITAHSGVRYTKNGINFIK